MKKKLSIMLCVALALGTLSSACVSDDMQAKKKVALSKKSITLKVGKSRKISVKNTKKAASWKIKSGKKAIQIKKAGKRAVKITAVKKGTARVQCKVGAKKLFCKVKVTKKKETVPTPTPPASVQPAASSGVPAVTPSAQPTETPEVVTPRPTHVPSEDCLMKEPAIFTKYTIPEGEPLTMLPGNGIYYHFFGTDFLRKDIEEMRFSNQIAPPEDAVALIDVSEKQNKSVMAWITDEDKDGYYEATIAQEGGVVANENSSYLCCDVGNVTGFENFYTENVKDMSYMFLSFRLDFNMRREKITLDLGDYFDTSGVENMKCMFQSDMAINTFQDDELRLGKAFSFASAKDTVLMFSAVGYRKIYVSSEDVKRYMLEDDNNCGIYSNGDFIIVEN